ncbi:hydantoinase/oxoprolinase family protein [Chelativorans sp. YIM 93263]|uniref:hydantoinase/oxoprolinase family protein n=1 Tax=Chelativorans sp. YIM 93263 TaxID=2906648 RepID=UPI0023793C77|nr:hydantoinase/oxoprolinase family protein [Chelativorans sp. YIM 93263]
MKHFGGGGSGANRIGVEIGGTFTDLVWSGPDGRLHTGKTPSTPDALHEAVLTVISEAGMPLGDVAGITHGSTVATNALIMRKGASAGLLTTDGFRDVVIVGRGDRDHGVYDMQYRRPAPPIRRGMIREVPERIGPDGEIIVPLDLEAAWREVEAFLSQGVEGIAISLIHAYRNPVHERALADMIRQRAPHVAVSASHEVSPEFREYERSVTTVVNAFVGPVVESYVHLLDAGLRDDAYNGLLKIMQSNGGAMPADAAGANAVRMLLSGPAAGVRAAMWFAERNGIKDVITLDMGGTSTDVAIAQGLVPSMVPELKIDGLPVRTASVDMATIGAGGGSIATIDPGGFLAVGPESAGAVPGPVCYGRGGTRPTVTDAQVIAGLLRPQQFFGGRMELSGSAAKAALAPLDSGGDATRAADAVLRLVNSNMAAAVRLVSTGRGIDPRDFTLVAYGGGGPLHAAMVAGELGITRVLVPWSPGLASAFGLLIADTLIDAAQSDLHGLNDTSLDAARCNDLRARCHELARTYGLEEGGYGIEIGLDMRYVGQAFELTVWTEGRARAKEELRRLFEDEHRASYGYARARLDVEVVSYRIRLTASSDARISTPLPAGKGNVPEEVPISIAGADLVAKALARNDLAVGGKVSGPAILSEPTSTTVVPPEWEAECLTTGDLILRRFS